MCVVALAKSAYGFIIWVIYLHLEMYMWTYMVDCKNFIKFNAWNILSTYAEISISLKVLMYILMTTNSNGINI